MNRRSFFTKLASGLIVAAAPDLFIPKLIKPIWKRSNYYFFVQEGRIVIDSRAVAHFISPVIKKMMTQTSTSEIIYEDWDENAPIIPLDLHYGPITRKDRKNHIVL